MCNFITTYHTRCGHKTKSTIRCPAYEAKPRRKCKKNHYQPFEHSLCPKCGGPPINKYPKVETMARAATIMTVDSESRRGTTRSSLSSQTTLPDLSRTSVSSTSTSTAKKDKRNMLNIFRRGSEKVKERRASKEGDISRGSSFSRGKQGSGDVEGGVERDAFGISRSSLSISTSTPAETDFNVEEKGKPERPWTEAKSFAKEPDELSPATRIDSARSDGWTDASFGTSYQSTSYLGESSRDFADDDWVGDGRDLTSLERANEYRDLIGEHPFEADWREEVALAGRREAERDMWAEDSAMDERAEEDEQIRDSEVQREVEESNRAEGARKEKEERAKFEQPKTHEADTERLKLGMMMPWEVAKSKNHDRDTVMSNQTTWSKLITQATEIPQIPRVVVTKNARNKVEVKVGPVSAKSLTGSIKGLSTPTTPRTPRTPTTPAPFVLPSTLPPKLNNLGSITEANREGTSATQLSKSSSLKTSSEPKSSLLGRIQSKKETHKEPIRPGPPTDFRHIQHTRPEEVLSKEQAFLMAKEWLNTLHDPNSTEEALGKSQLRISSERERVSGSDSLEEEKSGMYRSGEGRENEEENPKPYRGDAISGFSQHNDTAYESWRTDPKFESQLSNSSEGEKYRGTPRAPPSPSTPPTMPKWFGLLSSNSQRPSPSPPRNITHPLPSPSPSSWSLPLSTPIRNITQPIPSSSKVPSSSSSSSPLLRPPPHPSNHFSRNTPTNPSTNHPSPSPPISTPTTPDPFTPKFQMPKRGPTESLLVADKRLAEVSHARGGMKPPTQSFIEAKEKIGLRPYVIPDQVDNFKGARRR